MAKQKKNSGKSSGKNANSSFSALPILIFVVGAGILIWLIMGSFSSPKLVVNDDVAVVVSEEEEMVAETSTNAEPEIADEQPTQPEPLSDADRQKLLGMWERTDHPPYQIEVRSVKPNGLTDARYLNPQPINVAEGFIVGNDGKLALFMKMQDRGYEGSTYTLVYDETQDMLMGEYFQATQRQTYEVAFQRKRD